MLSTKNMSAYGGKTKAVIDAGNQELKINSIVLKAPPYDSEAYELQLNVESRPIEGDFEGFLVDVDNPNGPRYKGRVGRISFERYPFSNATLPSGRNISRDTEIMQALVFLGEQQGKRNEIDNINENIIEDFTRKASELLCDGEYYNFCVAGREWLNKEGYVNLQFFLPKRKQGHVPFEKIDNHPSEMISFDKNEHIISVNKPSNVNESSSSFEPKNVNVSGDDFNL